MPDGTATPTIEEYEAAKASVIRELVALLKVGTALGIPEGQIAGEFFAAFQTAAQDALGGEEGAAGAA